MPPRAMETSQCDSAQKKCTQPIRALGSRRMLQLTIWMNYPSLHQGDLFRASASSGEVDLQVIFARGLPVQRLQFGWQSDLVGYSHRFLNGRHRILDAMRLAWLQRDRLHVVNGIWTEPSFTAALVVLALAGSKYAIYSEAPEPNLPRPPGRKLLQAAFGRMLAPNATGALSISHLAVEFYRRLGVRKQAIYPFGYFRSHPHIANEISSKDKQSIEVIFCGQIIHRKGLDLLLEAMYPLFERYPGLSLTIIGSGEMLPAFLKAVVAHGASERIEFEGTIPPTDIPPRLAVADVLVLPSRWDGWGVVVNEAFSVGVPVIVSDSCGAADLVENGSNGYIFRNGDVEDLRARLSNLLERRHEWPHLRANSAATGRRISIEEVAPYFIACLRHMTGDLRERPHPPWARLSVLEDVTGS
jgi:glycosyltransferase involved in cell wall biosynthesis